MGGSQDSTHSAFAYALGGAENPLDTSTSSSETEMLLHETLQPTEPLLVPVVQSVGQIDVRANITKPEAASFVSSQEFIPKPISITNMMERGPAPAPIPAMMASTSFGSSYDGESTSFGSR